MELEFWVTICLGHGDGGDVSVTADVSRKEYELLNQCAGMTKRFKAMRAWKIFTSV